jgi:formate hydrogenlyase subunit 3/multisubunit Na+/H+ antiporter MnhD subunit
MNLLAILGIDDVDWISHGGCLITGLLLLIYFWVKEKEFNKDKKNKPLTLKFIKYIPVAILIIYCVLMGVVIWGYLPYKKIGEK